MSMSTKVSKLGEEITFLRTFDFSARPYTVRSADVQANAKGKKVLPAGTPLPSNDDKCLGLLLHETDVTDGDAAVALVYVGDVSAKKLAALGVSVDEAAKSALPRITFFE